MFHHFAFLAISIALLGLSASGVFVYVLRDRFARLQIRTLLGAGALLHAVATVVALAFLVRIHVALTFTLHNIAGLLEIYVLAMLPFFAGGSLLALALSRLTDRINLLYAADLVGAALGCLALVPLMNFLGAPGVVFFAASLCGLAAFWFAPQRRRTQVATSAVLLLAVSGALHLTGIVSFDVGETKGHKNDPILFSKWNSFSRVAVYARANADWLLSPTFKGVHPPSLLMDIDSSASTPILRTTGNIEDAAYLRYELTAIAYRLVERRGGFSALVIGPGDGRDLLSALVFGAQHVDGVEINPITARDVMLGRFRDYSGNIYANPRVTTHVEDGRSFVRCSSKRFDVIQASLVDTWAATAAGAYTLTENSLYTVEAFDDYIDHLTADGILTMTR